MKKVKGEKGTYVDGAVNLKDLQSQPSVLMAAFVCYLTLPVFWWLYLDAQLAAGAYPVNADSTAIPLVGFIVLWFIGLILIPMGLFFGVIGCRVFRNNR